MTQGWYPQYIKNFILQTCKKKQWTSTEMSNKGKKEFSLNTNQRNAFNQKIPLPIKLLTIYRKK